MQPMTKETISSQSILPRTNIPHIQANFTSVLNDSPDVLHIFFSQKKI
jgi:hypothetical protein